ncbi:pseudouridine synthase [Burkholderiales bacterium]|nr:pseudouridine synthase [Burkholderiales bacterium]
MTLHKNSKFTLIILFNKPFGVLSQFTDSKNRVTLSEFINVDSVYPAGRLDLDSEGLLILTDDGQIQQRLSNPRFDKIKTYWAQVEGEPKETAIDRLKSGVVINNRMTRPATAKKMSAPKLWDRVPPIRYRKSIPTSWIELGLTEGRNRQVRKMTAAVGHPTLRLVRYSVGALTIEGLEPGESRIIENHSRYGL